MRRSRVLFCAVLSPSCAVAWHYFSHNFGASSAWWVRTTMLWRFCNLTERKKKEKSCWRQAKHTKYQTLRADAPRLSQFNLLPNYQRFVSVASRTQKHFVLRGSWGVCVRVRAQRAARDPLGFAFSWLPSSPLSSSTADLVVRATKMYSEGDLTAYSSKFTYHQTFLICTRADIVFFFLFSLFCV